MSLTATYGNESYVWIEGYLVHIGDNLCGRLVPLESDS